MRGRAEGGGAGRRAEGGKVEGPRAGHSCAETQHPVGDVLDPAVVSRDRVWCRGAGLRWRGGDGKRAVGCAWAAPSTTRGCQAALHWGCPRGRMRSQLVKPPATVVRADPRRVCVPLPAAELEVEKTSYSIEVQHFSASKALQQSISLREIASVFVAMPRRSARPFLVPGWCPASLVLAAGKLRAISTHVFLFYLLSSIYDHLPAW